MKLLITGATGFIGRHAVSAARERDHDVVALVRAASRSRAPEGCTVVPGDLDDGEALTRALQGVDAVIHCAASLTGGEAEQAAVTIEGTRRLIEALRGSTCRRLVGVGTFANYDVASLPVGGTLDESCPLIEDFRGRHPYLAAKAEQERMLLALGAEDGWTVHVLRPGLVHGEGRAWFHHIGVRLGPVWLLFAPDGKLPLVSVEECALTLVRAAEHAAPLDGPVNVVADELPTRRDYARTVAKIENSTPTMIGLPWALVSLPARLLSPLNTRLPDILRLDALSERCKPVLPVRRRMR